MSRCGALRFGAARRGTVPDGVVNRMPRCHGAVNCVREMIRCGIHIPAIFVRSRDRQKTKGAHSTTVVLLRSADLAARAVHEALCREPATGCRYVRYTCRRVCRPLLSRRALSPSHVCSVHRYARFNSPILGGEVPAPL